MVYDYNWILGSEAALDCVAKCLTIIYGEDEAFAAWPAGPRTTWTWWTRLQPVDVEPKLAALVASCHADAWLSEDVGGSKCSWLRLDLGAAPASGARAPGPGPRPRRARRGTLPRVLDLGAGRPSRTRRDGLVKRSSPTTLGERIGGS